MQKQKKSWSRRLFWTYEKCYETAKKFKTRREFTLQCSSAYQISRRKGWIKDYTFWVPSRYRYWNEKNCYAEAKKYENVSSFRRRSSGAWRAAKLNGWLGQYKWFDKPRNTKWTFEAVKKIARKYKTFLDFRMNDYHAWLAGLRKGFNKKFTWLKVSPKAPPPKKDRWPRERVEKLAHECKTSHEFRTRHPGAYHKASKVGWLKEFNWLSSRNKTGKDYHYQKSKRWSFERICEIARKYTSFKKFREENDLCYMAAWRTGVLDRLDWLKKYGRD